MNSVEYALYSEIGDRRTNEDCLLAKEIEGAYIFTVADGMGGMPFGEVASELVCETVHKTILKNAVVNDDFFWHIYNQCQDNLVKEAKQRLTKMGTTLSILYIWNNTIYRAHVGDTRIYYFNHRSYVSRTGDHSVAQWLVNIGNMDEGDIRNSQERHSLIKTLCSNGAYALPDEAEPLSIEADMQFLICTDGFWELITEDDIEGFLQESGNPDEWMKKIAMKIDVSCGMKDNASAIAIWIK